MCLLSMMAAAPAMSDDFKRARKDADDDSAHESLVGGRLVASVATDVSLRNSEWTVQANTAARALAHRSRFCREGAVGSLCGAERKVIAVL